MPPGISVTTYIFNKPQLAHNDPEYRHKDWIGSLTNFIQCALIFRLSLILPLNL